MTGDTIVGLVANTSEPEPVSSVTAEARLALEGVPRNVATPVPRPLIPVDTGRPVAFVSVALLGVPSAGVTSVGLFANTSEPVPVSSVTALAKLAELGVARKVATPVPNPLMPVETGRPVALVRTAALGVPKSGVVSTGLVRVLFVRVSVLDTVTISTPSISSLLPASTLSMRSAEFAALRQAAPSLLAKRTTPD
jgi:hypothetical protein